jgi:hypothetical protein
MINKDSSDEANPEDVVGRNRVDSTDFCPNCDLVIDKNVKFKISSDRIKNATGPDSKILFGKLPLTSSSSFQIKHIHSSAFYKYHLFLFTIQINKVIIN